MGKVAIFIDGAFYNKRANYFWGEQSAEERAKSLVNYCKRHVNEDKKVQMDLYRIFYYDCPPSDKKIYHPLLKKTIDLSKTKQYEWTNEFLQELKHQRLFALRLGRLAEEQSYYTIKQDVLKKLLRGELSIEELSEKDFSILRSERSLSVVTKSSFFDSYVISQTEFFEGFFCKTALCYIIKGFFTSFCFHQKTSREDNTYFR